MNSVRKPSSRKPLTPQEQAFAKELCEKYHGAILRVIHTYLGPELSREREDILQDVFRMICEQINDFKTCKYPGALIRKITAYRVLEVRKKLGRFQPLPEDGEFLETNAETQGSPLYEWFPRSMKDEDKQILETIYGEGRDVVDVADDIGISASTLRQRLKRAKDRLKRDLKKT